MQILDTGENLAQENMRIDEELLEGLKGEPILHFYDWKNPSITHGYFIQPEKWLHLEKLKELGIDLARRPTGGGIVFHLWDLAFSFLLPSSHSCFSKNSLDNYRFVNNLVLQAVKDYMAINSPLNLIAQDKEAKFSFSSKFCMARPTKYDLMLEGKKIAGAAQRKKTQGYLHQGTISISHPELDVLKSTLKDPQITQEIFSNTCVLVEGNVTIENARLKLQTKLSAQFSQTLDNLFLETT
jgi:lipoate-protein ligase A